MTDKTGDVELPPLDEHCTRLKQGLHSETALDGLANAGKSCAFELQCRERQLLAALRESRELREQRDRWKIGCEEAKEQIEKWRQMHTALNAELASARKRIEELER